VRKQAAVPGTNFPNIRANIENDNTVAAAYERSLICPAPLIDRMEIVSMVSKPNPASLDPFDRQRSQARSITWLGRLFRLFAAGVSLTAPMKNTRQAAPSASIL
jgi:hypothetical protein